MRIIDTLDAMTETARGWLAAGTVGFVPIYARPHEGHHALLQSAHATTETLVVSLLDKYQLFNPTPSSVRPSRDLLQDAQALDNDPIDVLFIPRIEDLYPPNFTTHVQPTSLLASLLDHMHYPGYAQTLATTQVKLLQLVRPDIAFFGQKDAHQVALIRQLVRDLNIDVRVRVQPTARESDGLPFSSRNRLLTPQERAAASILHQSLSHARTLIDAGEKQAAALAGAITAQITAVPLVQLEQIMICHPDTLTPLATIAPPALIIATISIRGISFTDNILWMSDGQWRL